MSGSWKDIDLLVNDVAKAHTALRSANFHVSGTGRKRKAWVRLQMGQKIIKLDIHQDATLVSSVHARGTVERMHIAVLGLLLALTLQALGTVSRSAKVESDKECCEWLAGRMLQERLSWNRDLAGMLAVEHRLNWATALGPARYAAFLAMLGEISLFY